MIEQNYILNLVPNKVPLVVNCSQYDSLSRTINMSIYDGTEVYEIPNGTTATVRGTKQDNTGFEYPCTIEGSTVSFDIQDQMTIFSGRVPSEIRLTNDGEIIGTCNFEFYVEPTPLDPNVTISETDLPLLEEAEQNAIRAEQAASQATTVLASAVKSVNNTLPDANGNVNVSGISIPGGTQGQVLTKLSSAEGDFDWENVDGLPSGGTTGQVLTKQSSTDGDATWQNTQQLSGGTGISVSNSTINNTAPIWHGDEVGDLPVPINADQLQGHPASYFTELSEKTVIDLVWTNPSGASFSAQNISLNLSEYTLILINIRIYSNLDLFNVMLFTKNGFLQYLTNPCEVVNRRGFTVSNTSINFLDSEDFLVYNDVNSASVNNNRNIPYQIYGIK